MGQVAPLQSEYPGDEFFNGNVNKESTAMKVKAFDHVAISVSDTEKALELYVGKLGLRQVEKHHLEGKSVTRLGECRVHARSQPASPPRTRPKY